MAGDQDDIRFRLGDAGGDRADSASGDQLNTHPRIGVDLLEIIDQLREILDRIDVMVWGRRDQRHAFGRMSKARDQGGHLEAGKLAAFAGFGALSDLDLDFTTLVEIFGGHPEASGRHLLDGGVRIIPVRHGRVALGHFAAFARDGASADPVHGDIEDAVRFR